MKTYKVEGYLFSGKNKKEAVTTFFENHFNTFMCSYYLAFSTVYKRAFKI